ncbi:hypothetical protein S7335_2154 [Synechococcus sp. PCC 7335]|uniref:2TM domain-containing protein n=1 Tax=Synechococcus sp. (strain ATCC 29403 / PCC 7335) TaxID=91464 RepID=UPI00017ED294|nr:2TM domain-containing protein [Synechococcus sp. PCC 7335]EDX84457.1 hypothetical protein S7335_2154 [Synechococcus sp. PCC 7335]
MSTKNELRTFSSEDVQQILTIAMRRDMSSEAQLNEMAKELSIDEATLNYAVESWTVQKAQQQKKQQRRQRFYRFELLPYLSTNTFLLILNVWIAGAVTWAIYPLLGWGLALAIRMTGTTMCGGCRNKEDKRSTRV